MAEDLSFSKCSMNSDLDNQFGGGGSFIDEDELNKDNLEENEEDDEITLDSKYDKIGYITNFNTVKESEANIKFINNVKYYNEYKVLGNLGTGAVCQVELVEKDNVKYALKIVSKSFLDKKKKYEVDENGKMVKKSPLEGVLKEIAILKRVNHKNLVKLYEIIHNRKKGELYLVLEFCEKGDLMSYDQITNKFVVNKHLFEKKLQKGDVDITQLYYSEKQIRRFIRQIIRGLNYLHRIGIIHKDMKPNNVLLDKNNECKIIDFNFSAILQKQWVDNIGKNVNCNDYFRPAEICDLDDEEENDYRGMPIDIWALGVTAFILSYNKFPFDSENDDMFGLYDKIHKSKLVIPETPKRSDYFKYFLKRCLEKDPNKRITAEAIMDLKWINYGEKELLKQQCKKAAKIIPVQDDKYKYMITFTVGGEDVENLKKDKRPAIQKITSKIFDKIPTIKKGKKVNIKIKVKNKNNKK